MIHQQNGRVYHLSRNKVADSIYALVVGTILLGTLSGCTVGPDYAGPSTKTAMPDAFGKLGDPAFIPGKTDLRTWWTVFNDPLLDEVIAAAEADNRDLRIAIAKIAEARARVGIAESARSPQLTLGGGSTFSGDTNTGFASRAQSSLSAEASWELDVFGRIARQVEASEGLFTAVEEDRRDVQVSLFAEVATRYLSVRSLQAQLASALENIDSQREILELTRVLFRDGIGSRLDVVRAEGLVANSEAIIPQLRSQLNNDINTIALLVGTHPQALQFDLATATPIPMPPATIAVGIPAELLRQRPDIRAAERRLAAQSASVGIATAALYPEFSINGEIGTPLDGNPMVFSGGPSLRWTIFDGGRIRSQINVEDAILEQTMLLYEQAVLRALGEVETAMTRAADSARCRHESRRLCQRSVWSCQGALPRWPDRLPGCFDDSAGPHHRRGQCRRGKRPRRAEPG